MDIGTNELTRPFRIPRRKAAVNDDKATGDGTSEKTKRRRLGGDESDLRSPLASTSSIRKNDSAFSSRIVPPTKKKSLQEHPQTSVAHSKKSKPGELFERILDSMVNPPKERRKDPTQDDIDEAGPSGTSANLSSSPPKKTSVGLTREELERHQNDNSACYAFMQREGLMERLLGHKMLTGRVDSHIALGYLPFDPKDNSTSRTHNHSSSKMDDFPTICEPPQVGVANEERRGPKTPPGSPDHGANSSMLSSRGVGSASPSSPPPPPPADETDPAEDTRLRVDETPDLIAEMAELTKLPHNQLAECLGEELQKAMKQVDHKVLLETLKDALLKVGKRNDQQQQESQQQAACKEETHIHPVEMDLESAKSACGNDVATLLPPPPPAPLTTPPSSNMVPVIPVGLATAPPPSTVLPTPPPPPPPLVMLHPAAAAAAAPSVLFTTPTTGATTVYSYFPPPPQQQQQQQLIAEQQHQQAVKSSSTAVPGTPQQPPPLNATAPIIFTGVPYASTTNLVTANPQTVPTVNLASHTPASQTTGMVNALQNIANAPPPSYVTPGATPYANQTASAYTIQPGSSSTQQQPPLSVAPATIAPGNQLGLQMTPAPNTGLYGSSANNTAMIGSKPNEQPGTTVVPPPPPVPAPTPTGLHPYAGATNYNIPGASPTVPPPPIVAPYSIATTSITVQATGNNSFTPVTSLTQQQQQPSMVPNNTVPPPNFEIRPPEPIVSGLPASSHGFQDSRIPQNSYQPRFQVTTYPQHQQQQQQQQQLQNPNFPGTSSNGNGVADTGMGNIATTPQQQLDEKPVIPVVDFTRPPPPTRMQISSLEPSIRPSSSNSGTPVFNGGVTVSEPPGPLDVPPRFFPPSSSSNTVKLERPVSNSTPVAVIRPNYNNPSSSVTAQPSVLSQPIPLKNATTVFGTSKNSGPQEPITVPTSQNVIKTLLSALSIGQNSGTNAPSTAAPSNSSASMVQPETVGDTDREVDFCWPPASMDDRRWNQEPGPSGVPPGTEQQQQSRKGPAPPSLSASNSAATADAPRMLFFDQPASVNTPAPARPVGPPALRPRPPVPPPANRIPLNRLPAGGVPPGRGVVPPRMGAPFRPPAGSPMRPPFPPLRPRIPPPFFARRPPFPLRPPPPGMIRQPRPSFPR